jgi:hypothetical protein
MRRREYDMLRKMEDAFGRAMLDHFHGRDAWEIVERDDGNFSIGAGLELYFAPFRHWRPIERQAMRYVRGRVLDVGCGAGRLMLHLRDRGFEVVGIDNSPAAVETCRASESVKRRGVAAGTSRHEPGELRHRPDAWRESRPPRNARARTTTSSAPPSGHVGRRPYHRCEPGPDQGRRSGHGGVRATQPENRSFVRAEPSSDPLQKVRDALVRLP